MRKLFAAVLAALAFAAAPAAAQPTNQSTVCVNVQTAAVSARFSGMSLTTAAGSAGGKGIVLGILQLNTVANTIGIRITPSAVLDADLAVITPTAIFGVGTIETVIREGTAPTGALEGDFIGVAANTFNASSLYVPPGRTVTFLHTTATTASNISVCFAELE